MRMSRVIPALAREAYQRAKGEKQRAFSEYIRLMYRVTGRLAPGCDAKEFYAWVKQNVE